MDIIVSGRRFGKTTRLIRHLENYPNLIMVTFNRERVKQLEGMFPLLRGRFVDFRSLQKGLKDKEYVVDDLDMIIQQLVPGVIKEVTITANLQKLDTRHLSEEMIAKLVEYSL